MSDLVGALRTFITDYPAHKVPLADLRAHATQVDPTLLDDPAARDRLQTALTALAAAGHAVLPKGARHWDSRALPALPGWVSKPSTPRAVPPRAPARVWPQPLEAAAALATRPDEIAVLDQIAAWLREHPHPVPIPIEERSLQVLGDEKALAAQVTKRLFTSGALTLDLLACYPTPVPFASQHVPGTGPTALVVSENNATFHSLLTAARRLPEPSRPDLHIAWGAGGQFPVSVAATTLLDPAPVAVWYVGDIDVAGVRIATDAARTAATLDLPPVRPAAHLYRWLLDHGRPTPDRSNLTGSTAGQAPLAWLPEDLRAPVDALFRSGNRIPEETLSLTDLLTDPDLIRAFGTF